MKITLAVALIYPAAMAWLYFVALAGDSSERNPAFLFAIGLGKAAQFLLPVAAVWLLDRSALKPRKLTTRGLLPGLLFGLTVGVGMLALYHFWLKNLDLASQTPAKVRGKLQEMGFDSISAFVLLAIGISVVHSLLEEYYWRWFVFGQLRRYLPLSAAIVLSSVGFMAHHVIVVAVYFPGPLAFVALVVPICLAVAIGGAVWAWLYEWSGSLLAIWASHCIVDGAIMVVGFDMVFGQR